MAENHKVAGVCFMMAINNLYNNQGLKDPNIRNFVLAALFVWVWKLGFAVREKYILRVFEKDIWA